MDNSNEKHRWNIHAQSFEPRPVDENNASQDNLKPSESDSRSNSAGANQSSKVIDNGISYFPTTAHENDWLAQFTNMSLNSQFDLSPYLYMSSLSSGFLPSPSFQSSLATNRLSGNAKSAVPGVHSIPSIYNNNMFLNYSRINQPPLLSMPYTIQPSVPNMTNAAGRSRRNSCMVNKIFNTGDPHIDKHLTESYKTINPRSEFDLDINNSRFFVIKSYTEEHVHRSIKYGEWCSTQRGNDILDKAYRSVQAQHGHVFLFFSVNSSGYFCGVAEMMSEYDTGHRTSHWNEDKWQGGFLVRWLYVKDVPNKYLKHIILEYNDNRPITNSRDATEIKPVQKGYDTLRLIHEYHHNSSLFDDFEFYETREKESLTNIHGSNVP